MRGRITFVLPGARLSGRIVFDGDGPPPTAGEVWLTPFDLRRAVQGGPEPRGVLEPSGAFQIVDVAPGRYAISAADRRVNGEWTLARAAIGAEDILDVPIDLGIGDERADIVLTLTNRLTELSGTVTNGSGRPLAETDLVIAAAGARYRWPGSRRLRSITTTHDGTYFVRGLPPGEYVIGPRPALTSNVSPLFRPDTIVAAARVTLLPGEKRTQHVIVR